MLTKLNKLKTIGTNLTIITLLLLSAVLTVPVAYAQETFTIDINITGVTVNSGVVTVTGTVTCSPAAAFVNIVVGVSQSVGRFDTVRGQGDTSLLDCEGEVPFSAVVTADEGRFAGGKAFVFADAFGCSDFDCSSTDSDLDNKIVQLKRK